MTLDECKSNDEISLIAAFGLMLFSLKYLKKIKILNPRQSLNTLWLPVLFE